MQLIDGFPHGPDFFLSQILAVEEQLLDIQTAVAVTVFFKTAEGDAKLDAKLWANYDFDFDGTELKTEAYVDVRDALIDMREIELYAKETLKIMDEKLALVFSQSYKIFNKDLKLTAKATYTHEKFETWVALTSLAYNFNEKEFSAFNVSCGITSEAIIENAEIGLTYKKANFVRKEDGSFKKLGTIEAYASVSFE